MWDQSLLGRHPGKTKNSKMIQPTVLIIQLCYFERLNDDCSNTQATGTWKKFFLCSGSWSKFWTRPMKWESASSCSGSWVWNHRSETDEDKPERICGISSSPKCYRLTSDAHRDLRLCIRSRCGWMICRSAVSSVRHSSRMSCRTTAEDIIKTWSEGGSPLSLSSHTSIFKIEART